MFGVAEWIWALVAIVVYVPFPSRSGISLSGLNLTILAIDLSKDVDGPFASQEIMLKLAIRDSITRSEVDEHMS